MNKSNRNVFRKSAINFIISFKTRSRSKTAVSNIMFECLMDPQMILEVIVEIDLRVM